MSASAAIWMALIQRRRGLEGVETYPALIAELLRRGHSEADCEKIAGGNLLRAMEAAEKVAASMAGEVPPYVKP